MLAKRIIPCLDIQNGRTVKGIRFEGLRDAGDPVDLAQHYALEGADELVFLDITATHEQRDTLIQLVQEVASVLDIPFTVGGGIRQVSDFKTLLRAGADKISVNSAAFNRPALIREAADAFGSQCVITAIDAKWTGERWEVYLNGGRQATGRELYDWASEAVSQGAGEILLTSMDADGTRDGFDISMTRLLSQNLPVPVIASGGAGSIADFADVFTLAKADAALAASVFHFGEITIPTLKNALRAQSIPIR